MCVCVCRYAVNLEQSIVEIAAIFGTDWIQIWNMNDAKSPDYREYCYFVPVSITELYLSMFT